MASTYDDFGWAKFFSAVNTLVGPGTIQERLADAWLFQMVHIRPECLHEEVQEKFAALDARMTSKPADGDEGRIRASTRDLSDDEGREIAQGVVSIFNDIVEELAVKRSS